MTRPTKQLALGIGPAEEPASPAIERVELLDAGTLNVIRREKGTATVRKHLADGRILEIVLPEQLITIAAPDVINDVEPPQGAASTVSGAVAGVSESTAPSVRRFRQRAAEDLEQLRIAAGRRGRLDELHRLLDAEVGLQAALHPDHYAELRVLPVLGVKPPTDRKARYRYRLEYSRRLVKAVMESRGYSDYERSLAVRWFTDGLLKQTAV